MRGSRRGVCFEKGVGWLSRRNSTINIFLCLMRPKPIRKRGYVLIIAKTHQREGWVYSFSRAESDACTKRPQRVRTHLLVQPEAVRLVCSVNDVLQVLPHELEELLEHLLNLGLFERTHLFCSSLSMKPTVLRATPLSLSAQGRCATPVKRGTRVLRSYYSRRLLGVLRLLSSVAVQEWMATGRGENTKQKYKYKYSRGGGGGGGQR